MGSNDHLVFHDAIICGYTTETWRSDPFDVPLEQVVDISSIKSFEKNFTKAILSINRRRSQLLAVYHNGGLSLFGFGY